MRVTLVQFSITLIIISTMCSRSCSTFISSKLKKESIVSKCALFGKTIYIKRDDLSNLNNAAPVSGNKIRKLLFLDHYLHDFEHKRLSSTTSKSNGLVIGSFGGYQSNAMYAIAQLTSLYENCKFVYFTKNLPSDIVTNPIGNLKSVMQHPNFYVRRFYSLSYFPIIFITYSLYFMILLCCI